MATTPFPKPPVAAIPTKEVIVEGLLTHFNVPIPVENTPIPLIQDAPKHPVPSTLTEAMQTPWAPQWAEAAVDEWLSLVANDTWTLVDKEPHMKILPCRWVFAIKTNEHGELDRFKARLVAGGHRQREGVDYAETYAPVTRLSSLRILLSVAAHRKWEVHTLDIKTAFLHGDIDVDVYMNQPPGFIDGQNKVAKLTKCLYGLKQAPKAWYEKLSSTLRDLNFEPCSADSSLWTTVDGHTPMYLATIVDDMAITTPSVELTTEIISKILATYPGKNMGIMSHFNGMRCAWFDNGRQCMLLQPVHVDKMFEEFSHLADLGTYRAVPMKPGLVLCKSGTNTHPMSPPLDVKKYHYRGIVGSLNYVACCTRPDITYTVNQLARYSNAPTVAHWEAAIDCLRYLITTKYWGIQLGGGSPDEMQAHVKYKPARDVPAVAYADANHGVGIDDRKSVNGSLIKVLGGPVSWSSHVQPTQSISTVESEIHAMSCASRESLWVAKLLTKFGLEAKPFLIRGDSASGIAALVNHQYTRHTKHIGIHQDFLKDQYRHGELEFEHIKGTDNPADIFTKALPRPAFEKHRAAIGMMQLPTTLW